MAPKTHCKRGHELAGDNLYVHNGRRACRACRRQYVSPTPCKAVGCDKPKKRHGFCLKHYKRWDRYGDPNVTTRFPATPDARADFFARVTVSETGCWTWTGPLSKGYGRHRGQLAHRVSYEMHVGPIPEGLTIDHTCHNSDQTCDGGETCEHRRCVNPAHLEAVPMVVNSLRGKSLNAKNARKTHCSKGHPFDEENTLYVPGGRRCRICRDAANDYHNRLAKEQRQQRRAS